MLGDRARLRRDLDHYGWLLVAWRWLGQAAERFLGVRVFAIWRESLADVELYALPEGVIAAELSPEQLRDLVSDNPELEISPEFAEGAIARGDVCCAAVRDGSVVGYTWRSTHGSTPHGDGVVVEFPPDTCYTYKSFVVPSERGGQTAWALTSLAIDGLFARGYRWNIWFSAIHNITMRSWRKYPWSKKNKDGTPSNDIGFAGYVKWRPWVWCFRTPGVAKAGFRFVKAAPR